MSLSQLQLVFSQRDQNNNKNLAEYPLVFYYYYYKKVAALCGINLVPVRGAPSGEPHVSDGDRHKAQGLGLAQRSAQLKTVLAPLACTRRCQWSLRPCGVFLTAPSKTRKLKTTKPTCLACHHRSLPPSRTIATEDQLFFCRLPLGMASSHHHVETVSVRCSACVVL